MNRVPGLDLLRALAIVSVIFTHAAVLEQVPVAGQIATFGWMGVDLFFALSGYLIGNQLLQPIARGEAIGAGSFYARRLFRTLPAYLVVVGLYFTVPVFRERPEIQPLWQFLTFTENLFIDFTQPKAFSHVWSLCVEEHFYLVAPLIVWLVARRPSRAKAVGVCLAVLIGGMALRGYVWIHDLSPAKRVSYGHAFIQLLMERIYYPTWTRLDGLVFGVMLATLRTFRPRAWETMMRRGDLVLGAAVAGLALSIWMFGTQWALLPTVIGYPILSLSMTGLVAAGASRVSLIGRWHVPGAGPVAAIAYSLYLTHKQVYHMVTLALGGRLDGHPLIAFLVMAGSAVFVGAGLYLAVERPFLRLRDRLIRRQGAPATPMEEAPA